MDHPPLRLVNRVYELRRRLGLSQAELGRVWEVPARAVALWEAGLGGGWWTAEVGRDLDAVLDALDAVSSRRGARGEALARSVLSREGRAVRGAPGAR